MKRRSPLVRDVTTAGPGERGFRGIDAIESEFLVTDMLLAIPSLSEAQKRAYQDTVEEAKRLCEMIDLVNLDDTPAEDIMIILRKIVALGPSQKILARELGVTTGTVSRWSSGDNPPQRFARPHIVRDLRRIADAIVDRLNAYPARFKPRRDSRLKVVTRTP